MGDDPAYIRDFKAYARTPLQTVDLDDVQRELYNTNDRTLAVMLASVVDLALTDLIRSRMRTDLNSEMRGALLDPDGPIGTFSSKIALAYAFGLTGPIFKHDLTLIRIIRNEFAHSRRPISFEDNESDGICSHLKTPEQPGAHTPFGYLNLVPERLF